MTMLEPTAINDPFLTYRAGAIRALGKRMVRDIIEIGRLLSECKEHVGHGNFLPWVKEEFGWSDKQAERFISVFALAQTKIDNLSEMTIDASALYLLAAPSTPDDLRDDVIARGTNGETIKHADVARLIDEAKAGQASEHERQLKALAEKYESEAAKLRADIGDALSPEALQAAIDDALAPLLDKIKRLERERDKRNEDTPKRPDPHGLPTTAIVNALHALTLALTITPKQVIARHAMVAEATSQRLSALIAEPVRDAKTVSRWLEKFLEESAQ